MKERVSMSAAARRPVVRRLAVAALGVGLFVLAGVVPGGEAAAQSSVRPPEPPAAGAPAAPGESRIPDSPRDAAAPAGEAGDLSVLGGASDAEMWSRIRRGGAFGTQVPDAQAGVLVQTAGIEWVRERGEGSTLRVWGGWAMAATLGLLVLFYLARGRVRIEQGRCDETICRFTGLERFTHWTMAVSFIVLALTGLNMLYGRGVLLDLFGHETYAALAGWGKIAHDTVAFAFMAAVVLAFVLWIAHNLPSRHDLTWIAQGGGILFRHKHPPAKKFNLGQKVVFWLVLILGVSISASGLALMFPFELSLFSKTFAVLNAVGFDLNAELTPIQEMQYAQLWHSMVAFAFVVIIIAHIYIGTLGMEAAFAAMGTGNVDLNWAKEHHGLWVEEVQAREREAAGAAPAGATPAE